MVLTLAQVFTETHAGISSRESVLPAFVQMFSAVTQYSSRLVELDIWLSFPRFSDPENFNLRGARGTGVLLFGQE